MIYRIKKLPVLSLKVLISSSRQSKQFEPAQADFDNDCMALNKGLI